MRHCRLPLPGTALALLLGLGWFTPASAAVSQQSRSVRIVDESDHPVASALVDIDLTGHRYAQRTDTAGIATFTVASNEPTAYLRVRIIGYTPWAGSVTWHDSAAPVVVRLVSVTQTLSEVVVRDQSPNVPRIAAIDERIARGTASAVITRDAIVRRNPVALSQMLRGVAGLRVADSSGATVAISTRGMKTERLRPVPCVMRISVDGVVLSASTDVNQVTPVDVHAIEIYFGPARIPAEFGGVRSDSWCGLIAIWTRAG